MSKFNCDICNDTGIDITLGQVGTCRCNSTNFYIVDIGYGLELKFDGYREEKQWTLLDKSGGRILDGDFIDVVDYFVDNVVIYDSPHHDHLCPCGREWLTGGQADIRTTKRMINTWCDETNQPNEVLEIVTGFWDWSENR